MGNQGKKRGTGRATRSTSVSLSGIVKTANGKYAVKIRVGGKTLLVPSGGDKKPKVAEIQRKLRKLGNKVSASLTPRQGGKVQIGLTGAEGSISFLGQNP